MLSISNFESEFLDIRIARCDLDELNDEIIAEKFEEALFEEASKLVITEDEHVTILNIQPVNKS